MHLPDNIERAFIEASSCQSINCFNAASAMYRLCLDMSTKDLLPEDGNTDNGLNNKIRRSLGLRLKWLFDNNKLPEALSDIANCIKEDGNNGAHEGVLTANEAADIADFTYLLLERLYTEPEKVRLVKERQLQRREQG